MNHLKNLQLLADLDEKIVKQFEEITGQIYLSHSFIFKIQEYGPKKIVIQVTQQKRSDENHLTSKEIISFTKSNLGKFFIDKNLHVHPIPYINAPPEKVDASWISSKMLATNTKIKDIAAETGLRIYELSPYIYDSKPLTRQMKALFWFYFAFKEK